MPPEDLYKYRYGYAQPNNIEQYPNYNPDWISSKIPCATVTVTPPGQTTTMIVSIPSGYGLRLEELQEPDRISFYATVTLWGRVLKRLCRQGFGPGSIETLIHDIWLDAEKVHTELAYIEQSSRSRTPP